MSESQIDIWQVAASLSLVAVAILIAWWQRTRMEVDILTATVRSFVQLTAIGFAIQFIFDRDEIWFVLLLLAVMVGFGTYTARYRARDVPDCVVPIALALTLAAVTTLGLVVALGIFEPEPRFLVPVGGMVIGNAMNAASVALSRMAFEIDSSRAEIEAKLSLGADSRRASEGIVIRCLRSGTIPLIDSTKTAGLIFFPGTMVGMLVAGASPLDAVKLQLVLLYALLGSVTISAMTVSLLAYRGFFTPDHQLREL